jgi:hypothetical protein
MALVTDCVPSRTQTRLVGLVAIVADWEVL